MTDAMEDGRSAKKLAPVVDAATTTMAMELEKLKVENGALRSNIQSLQVTLKGQVLDGKPPI
jgi:hypothetical protein